MHLINPHIMITSDNPMPKKILFVCLGNICRSPAAEGIMRSIADPAVVTVDSAGTGRYHIGQLPDRRMRVHARERGLELTHHCRQVTPADFDEFDMIIGMDGANIADLHRIAPSPEAGKKIHAMAEYFDPGSRWDHVPDPYYEGSDGFELVLDLLQEGCRNLYDQIRQS